MSYYYYTKTHMFNVPHMMYKIRCVKNILQFVSLRNSQHMLK